MPATKGGRRFRPHQRGRPQVMENGTYVTFMMDEAELIALEEWAFKLRRSRSAHIRQLLLQAMANHEIPVKSLEESLRAAELVSA